MQTLIIEIDSTGKAKELSSVLSSLDFVKKVSTVRKTKTLIAEKLGAPAKKELSVKPSNASAMVGGKDIDDSKSKKVKIEMWYYKNIVKYDPKRTYKETEITFVNDRVLNIAFFNNR